MPEEMERAPTSHAAAPDTVVVAAPGVRRGEAVSALHQRDATPTTGERPVAPVGAGPASDEARWRAGVVGGRRGGS